MFLKNHYQSLVNDVSEQAIAYGRDPSSITIVAVSKGQPVDRIVEVWEGGCSDFGENRIQEVLPKLEGTSSLIRWHFIGSIQKNKISKVLGWFQLIHSVDSLDLARLISHKSIEKGIVTPVLLQVNTSGEITKHGFSTSDFIRDIQEIKTFQGLRLEGLMTMAPLVEDEKTIRSCFAELRQLKEDYSVGPHLSMGMSHDYRWAIAEGATLLRIGSKIFQS